MGVHDVEVDHHAYRGFASIGYALTQRRRAGAGWLVLAGNHVFIQTVHVTGTVVVALCHLQQGSAEVTVGQRVESGQSIGRCGNSGNSTEPHLHLHAVDSLDILRANAVPIQFDGTVPHNGIIVERH